MLPLAKNGFIITPTEGNQGTLNAIMRSMVLTILLAFFLLVLKVFS